MDDAQRRAKLQEIYELAQGSEEFEGGITWEPETEALVVGNWAFFAIDEIGDLALSFHLDSHPVAVAKLTRFLVTHEVPFVLHEAFTVDDDDRIVFESDTGVRIRRARQAPGLIPLSPLGRGQGEGRFSPSSVDTSTPFCYPRKLVVGW